jgi:hypothetical protein
MVHFKTIFALLIPAALVSAAAIPPTGLPTMDIAQPTADTPAATPLPTYIIPHPHRGPKLSNALLRLRQAKQRGGPGRNVNEQERQAKDKLQEMKEVLMNEWKLTEVEAMTELEEMFEAFEF